MDPKSRSMSPGGPSSSVAGFIGGRSLQMVALAVLAAAIIIGFSLADDYGISTDEPENYAVGVDGQRAYSSWQGYQDYLAHGDPLSHHGPSYFMVYATGAKWIEMVLGWRLSDARHLINLLTYLAGCVGFYFLAKRLMRPPYALAATMFFGLQPLLLGHGFINQKDTPFLASFTLAVVLGLSALDRLADDLGAAALDDDPASADGRRQPARAAQRPYWGIGLLVLSGLIVVDLFWTQIGLQTAQSILAQLYSEAGRGPLQWAFNRVAEDAYKTPLSLYMAKLRWAYWIVRGILLPLVSGGVVLGMLWLSPEGANPAGRVRSGTWLLLIISGAALGFTVSIRPIGGLAGALLALYGLWTLRWRGMPWLILIGLAAAAACYLTWPYLWDAPVSKLVASLTLASDFNKPTLFAGNIILGDQLPWIYFPQLAGITLTEPFAFLFPLGLVAVGSGIRRKEISAIDVVVVGLWAAVPLFGLLVLKMEVYDNLRQLLFVLVPLFLVAGVGLEWAARQLGRAWLKAALALIVLMPAVPAISYMHPYEYSYYNSYIGGVSGAAGRFTVDRWCTSYREAMQYVNTAASPDAEVTALNSPMTAEPFARADLSVSRAYERPTEDSSYLLTCSFFVGGYRESSEWKRVHVVGRGAAVFSEVYARVGGS
jgi:hypothetical protein